MFETNVKMMTRLAFVSEKRAATFKFIFLQSSKAGFVQGVVLVVLAGTRRLLGFFIGEETSSGFVGFLFGVYQLIMALHAFLGLVDASASKKLPSRSGENKLNQEQHSSSEMRHKRGLIPAKKDHWSFWFQLTLLFSLVLPFVFHFIPSERDTGDMAQLLAIQWLCKFVCFFSFPREIIDVSP